MPKRDEALRAAPCPPAPHSLRDRAGNELAWEVGRSAWDESGWRLDRLGIAWTDDLAAKLPPLVDAYNAAQTEEGLAAIGQALLTAGAKLREAEAQRTTPPNAVPLRTQRVGGSKKGTPPLSDEDHLAASVGASYAICDFGVSVTEAVHERVATLVQERRAEHERFLAGYKKPPDLATIEAANRRMHSLDLEIGRVIVAEVGIDAARGENERIVAAINAATAGPVDEHDET